MEKIAVIYWSGTGNTELMAESIAEGIKSTGTEVDLFSVSDFKNEINDYSKIAFGCSAMGDEVLEENEFEPFFSSIENSLKGKKVALFGSYGWGDGKWMRDWQDRVSFVGASLFNGKGIIINGTPSPSDKDDLKDLGKKFAEY